MRSEGKKQQAAISGLMPRGSTENAYHHLNDMAKKTGVAKRILVIRAIEEYWERYFSPRAGSTDEQQALARAALKDVLEEKQKVLEALRKSSPVTIPGAQI